MRPIDEGTSTEPLNEGGWPGETAEGRAHFGDFKLDLKTGELVCGGRIVPLQSQVARTLVLLVARAGRLVLREELIRHLWPDVIVEYDQGLNNTIRLLRASLGDDANHPRFIQTVPRRGYRFIALVQVEAGPEPLATSSATSEAEPGSTAVRAPRRRRVRFAPALSGLALVAAAASLWLVGSREVEELPTLAVLPFAGSETGSEALGSSLAQELTRELSVVPCGPLRVIGQSSAARAGSAGASPLAAGRQLGASHLVVGSVAEDGAALSLSVAVLRVSDGTELWKERVSTSWEELLTTQSVLAGEIANRVGDVVGACPRPKVPEVEPSAVEGYLRARYLASRGRWEGALPLLREVVAAAPEFAAGHVALGEALVASSEAVERTIEARRSAVTALRLSPNDPQAHLLRARVALGFEWDWRRAERHLERAAELAAGEPTVHLARAFYLSSLGRHQEALESAEIAKKLDPLSTTIQGDLAMLYFWAEDWVGVRREAERLLDLEPETGLARSLRLEALVQQHDWDLARALALSVYGEDADLGSAGGPDLKRRLLAIQEQHWRAAAPGPTREMILASLAAQQGRAHDALRHLHQAVELRSSYVPFLATDPHFSTLASNREFQELLAAVGHPLAQIAPGDGIARARGL